MSLKNWGFGALFSILSLGFTPAVAEVTISGGQLVVIGNGSASAIPDQATVRLGARETAKTAQDALAKSSRATAAILSRLEDAGLDARDIQTSSISLGPIWSDDRNAQNADPLPPIGFEASSRITAVLRDLDKLGDLLDAVAQDGANSFSGFSFGLQDRQPVVDAAARDAVKDARRKAMLYAEAAGVQLGDILLITEDLDGGGGYPAPMLEMSASRSSPVPVAKGEITLTDSIKMIFALQP